jgi:hypothetical protein
MKQKPEVSKIKNMVEEKIRGHEEKKAIENQTQL